jgi:hypothetical protein
MRRGFAFVHLENRMSFLSPFIWRRLHALGTCKQTVHCERFEEFGIDAGYCLDRYSIEYADGAIRTVP